MRPAPRRCVVHSRGESPCRVDNSLDSTKLYSVDLASNNPDEDAILCGEGGGLRTLSGTSRVLSAPKHKPEDEMKKWSKPSFQNMRYGFEINLYVTVR